MDNLSYDKLKSLATPGTLHIEGPKRGSADEYEVLVLCGEGTWLGELNVSQWDPVAINGPTTKDGADQRALANALLIKHRYNNFDDLKNALERATTALANVLHGGVFEQECIDNDICNELDDILAKVKEIKS